MGLLFHPDLIAGTPLGKTIKNYSFFSYEMNEVLYLSKKERKILVESLEKIAFEIDHNIAQHSKTLIISNNELLLNYCMRFYDRQFITRSNANKDILSRFKKTSN
jgi:transcriptional regulator, AraC family